MLSYRSEPRRRGIPTPSRQANFTLPEDLLEELRKTVPRGEQSRVVGEALRNELKRIKFQKSLATAFGAWKASDHPELARGARRFVRRVRRSRRGRRRSARS
jgi:hypothetical protein